MKRKIISIFLMIVLLFSLSPIALAQNEGDSRNSADTSESTDMTDTEDTDDTTTVRSTKRQRPNLEKPKPLLLRARKVNKAVVKNYVAVKEEFIKARQLQMKSREKFSNAKSKIKECEEQDTDECKQVRQNVKTGSKNFLGNSADAIIKHLEKLKNKIQSNERLTEDEVTQIISEIDAKIAEIEEAKATAESAETKKEIVEAAKVIRAKWKPIKNHAVYWTGKLINAKMGGVLVKLDHLEDRLERALAKMEENGKDVSEIEPMVEEFNGFLVNARASFDQAVESYKQFKETKVKTDLDAGKRHMNAARKELVKAHKNLKDIVRAIKAAQGNTELDEASEETPIEEEEEEGED